jgi:hypothetical protein
MTTTEMTRIDVHLSRLNTRNDKVYATFGEAKSQVIVDKRDPELLRELKIKRADDGFFFVGPDFFDIHRSSVGELIAMVN